MQDLARDLYFTTEDRKYALPCEVLIEDFDSCTRYMTHSPIQTPSTGILPLKYLIASLLIPPSESG